MGCHPGVSNLKRLLENRVVQHFLAWELLPTSGVVTGFTRIIAN